MMKKMYAVTITKLDGIEGKTTFKNVVYVRTADIEKYIDKWVEDTAKKPHWWMAYPGGYDWDKMDYTTPDRPTYKEIEFIEA